MTFPLSVYNHIFNIDPKIRYAGFYHDGKLDGQMRWGVENILTAEESKKSLNQSIKRWNERRELSTKLGDPVYTVTLYKTIKRFTMQLDDGTMLLVSTEADANIDKIINDLLNTKDTILQHLSSPQ